MEGMSQRELFGFNDMKPQVSLRKIITKERILEVQAMLNKNNGKGAVEALRDMRHKLEALEKRIRNAPPKNNTKRKEN